MDGLHKRVGEITKQDWPITIEVISHVDELLNASWIEAPDVETKKRVAEMGTWFVGGFLTGLRGEEMLMIELADTKHSLVQLTHPVDPHFCFQVLGRTKGRQENGRHFEMPCIATTTGTGLKPGRWTRRLVKLLDNEGRSTGRLFQRKFRVPRLKEFEEDFFKVLEMVQTTTELIEFTVNLREAAGIERTLRRGVTSHAQNMQVPRPLFDAINRWRKETNGRRDVTMVDHYSKLDSLKPTYLRFSKAL